MDRRQLFESFLDSLQFPKTYNRDFLFDCMMSTLEGGKDLSEINPRFSTFSINPASLVLYMINEHVFFLSAHPEKTEEEIIKDENYRNLLVSVTLDKYYTNEHLAYRMGSLASRFSPSVSTISLYLNFILGMLSRYESNKPKGTLLTDIMMKGFQMASCVLKLLEGGFETEAFSTWRTLHENECILHALVKNGQPAIEAYLRHMRYGLAFRGGIPSKEETDAVFVEIKERMKKADLKSKDMKRFIEYGWLLDCKGVDTLEGFKLNFRDGVQRVAGLTQYSKTYEMSSEIAHSSPLLIYSRKNYFFFASMISLYESFFRLEKIFATIYLSSVQEDDAKRYVGMRSLYYPEIMYTYQYLKKQFAAPQSGEIK